MATRVWQEFWRRRLPGGEGLEGGGDEAGRVRRRPGAVRVVVRRVHRHAAAGALADPLQHLAALADLDELVGDAGEAVGPGALALLEVACATMILRWVVGESGAEFTALELPAPVSKIDKLKSLSKGIFGGLF